MISMFNTMMFLMVLHKRWHGVVYWILVWGCYSWWCYAIILYSCLCCGNNVIYWLYTDDYEDDLQVVQVVSCCFCSNIMTGTWFYIVRENMILVILLWCYDGIRWYMFFCILRIVKILCSGICTQMHVVILMRFNFVNMILTHDCPPVSGNCFKGFTQRPGGTDIYDDWMVF